MACSGIVNELRTIQQAREEEILSQRDFNKRFNRLYSDLLSTASMLHAYDIVMPVVDRELTSTFWRWFNNWRCYVFELTQHQVYHLLQIRTRRHRFKSLINQYRPSQDFIRADPTPRFRIRQINPAAVV